MHTIKTLQKFGQQLYHTFFVDIPSLEDMLENFSPLSRCEVVAILHYDKQFCKQIPVIFIRKTGTNNIFLHLLFQLHLFCMR